MLRFSTSLRNAAALAVFNNAALFSRNAAFSCAPELRLHIGRVDWPAVDNSGSPAQNLVKTYRLSNY